MIVEPLRRWDLAIVGGYCVLLYGLVLSVGGPLTLHEGVLSQTARQMAADHDWAVPHYGQAPWLERPPLPQWLTIAIAQVVGRCDREWVIRIGPALAATLTVLLTTWLAARFHGRTLGMLSGFVLASMYQFVRYATLAEADMFLAPIVASTLTMFAYLELVRPRAADESVNFVGARPWPVAGFFVVLGLTGLAKGLVFGTVMATVPIAGYLLWHFSIRGTLRYVWLWGWLLALTIMLAWPLAVYQRYPDALELWDFDLRGRLNGGYLREPAWYYLANWFWVVLPWPICGILGLILTARRAFTERDSPYRFWWCWAILPPLFFSFAQGKHHHYMIHFLAPWAVLAAVGAQELWSAAQAWPGWLRRPLAVPALLGVALAIALEIWGQRLPGPAWLPRMLLVSGPLSLFALWWAALHRRALVAVGAGFALLIAVYFAAFAYKGLYLHRSLDDTEFLREVALRVPPTSPILVHTDPEALEGLRQTFYFDARAILLHNLSFLRDERFKGGDVFLVSRAREQPRIDRYGATEILLQSKQSRREESALDRWTLFRVHFHEGLARRTADVRISPMQAMYRVDGPSLD